MQIYVLFLYRVFALMYYIHIHALKSKEEKSNQRMALFCLFFNLVELLGEILLDLIK